MSRSIQVQDLGRLQQIVGVLAKYGFGQLFTSLGIGDGPPTADPDAETSPLARRIRQALVELGPTYVKLGQVLSVRPDILPPDVIRELESLQDAVPPMSEEDVRAIVDEELGLAFDSAFAEFDFTPLGSASIAQVHRARLHSGQEVAVKVQRRNIASKIRSDMHILYTLAGVLEKRLSLPGLHTPTMVVREFDVAISNELDFTQEMRACERFRRNFASDKTILVPAVYPRWSTRRVLVMELVHGKPLKDFLGVAQTTPESRAMAHALMECAYQQIFVHGFFHGDPHPGNLFITDDGRVALLDFGLTGSLTGQMQDTIIAGFTAMVFRDAETLAMTVYRAGATSDRVDLREFRAEIERLMDRYYGMSLEELTEDPSTLMEVIRIAARFHIDLPAEFAVLSRTFGLVEGILRGLMPGVDIVEEVKPYAQRLVASRLAPERVAVDLARSLVQLQGHFKELPTQLTQVLMDLEAGQISFEVKTHGTRRMEEAIRMGGLRVSLALFASTITLGSMLFLAAWSPTLFGIPLFGLLGLGLSVLGAILFGALGIHVFFARFLALSFWQGLISGVLRFFSFRKRREERRERREREKRREKMR